MTNRILFLLIAAVVIFGSCSKSDNQFTISGVITHAAGDTIYLEEVHTATVKPADKVKINKDGEFKFKGTVSLPTFYLLKLNNSKFITLLVDSTDNVVVKADAANFHREYNVSGSIGSQQVRMLDRHLRKTQLKLDSLESLNKLYDGNPDYDDVRPKWVEQYDSIVQEQIDFSTNFVRENPFSMASVWALYQKFYNNQYIIHDLQVMKTAASALNAVYPNSEQVKALYNNTLQFIREQQAQRMQQWIEEQGTNSPELVLPDQNGKEIALSSLKGKVVLLQFWAAVDRGSRIQNPVLVELYEKYKRKGFEIYQVSVDDNRAEWVDAIDKDQLKWTNVGDMKGSVIATQVFNVPGVPFNYLLDQEGAVVARNLQGPALDKAIGSLLK
ncbi:TlpA disulfide reductase family protein [Maribellus sp. YY47]|uniref:TlpA disulfide reductase family protein n=1 Tax=Maribellus sp. YY47 TaxID=2929486 RepID=UPI0020006CA6|nr:TlpA disulfide reductase family protein [Maribellus sp. YY47]MCK3685856.1 AhpC/TSA family protein [Maribellus sp. YY47]